MAAATDQIITTDPSTPSIIPVITTTSTLTTSTTTTGTVPTKTSAEIIDETKRKCSLGSITVESLSASSSSSSLGSANSTTLSASDHQSISSKLTDSNSSKIQHTGNLTNNNTANNNKPMVSITQMAAKGQPQKVLPFESIKTQLERNNIQPNAQYIQRHIDNLISHNEAIIDNWNLVNVRSSCNSSASAGNETASSVNNSSCKSTTPPPPSLGVSRTQPKGSVGDLTSGLLAGANDIERPSSSQGRRYQQTGGITCITWPPANNQRLPASRSRKRWSTTALGGLQQLRQQNQQPTIDISMNNNPGSSSFNAQSTPSSISPLECAQKQRSLEEIQSDWAQTLRQSSMDQQQHQAPFQFKHSLEFDNSYNELLRRSSLQQLSRGGTNPLNLESSAASSFMLSPGHHQHPQTTAVICAPGQQSINHTYDTTASRLIHHQHHANFLPLAPIPSSPQQQHPLSTSEIQRFLELHRAQQATESQLESAIQNLSLRRREEDFLQQQQQKHLSQEQQQQLQSMLQNQALLNHRHEAADINSGGTTLFVPMDFLSNAARTHTHTHVDRNLLEDPAVLASLFQERQLPSLVGSVSGAGAVQDSFWQKHQQHNQRGDKVDLFTGVTVPTGELEKLQQQQQVRNLSPTMSSSSISQINRRQHHSMVHELDPSLISQLLATMCTENNNPKRQQSMQQQSCYEGQPIPTVTHSERSEFLNGPLDSATPAHRCEVCDIPFWTRDLLKYHRLTQCVTKQSTATSDKPLAFNFVGPNNYELLNQQVQQTIEDQSSHHHPLSVANRGKPSKSVSPPRSFGTAAAVNFNVVANCRDAIQQQHLNPDEVPPSCKKTQIDDATVRAGAVGASGGDRTRIDELSILKQQLLQSTAAAAPATGRSKSGMVIAPEALPLKKRKISEPNMRYRMT